MQKYRQLAGNYLKDRIGHYFRRRRNYRMTGLERKFGDFAREEGLPLKFTGDGSYWIGRKNPDFISTDGKKIAVEVFHPKYKIWNFGSVGRYIRDRAKYFWDRGYKTLFLSADEMSGRNWKPLANKKLEALYSTI